MLSEYQCLRKLGSFSIDDPEADRKLIENLDRRRVRVQVIEACWHFGFGSPDGLHRMRVKAFLDDLCARGELVQPIAGLYCRPDMTEGRATVEQAVKQLESLRDFKRRFKAEAAESPKPKATPKKRHVRRSPDTHQRDAQVAALLAFVGARGEVTVASMKEEAVRLAFPDRRINYLIQYMQETTKIVRVSYGIYGLPPETAAVQPEQEPTP